MLARYKIYRGPRPPADPLPSGTRQDTRWRTKHILRPTEELVEGYFAGDADEAWSQFASAYLGLLESRFDADRRPFDELAERAMEGDVFLGCSCPTKKNPNVEHCHTSLALKFMRRKYPRLKVQMPTSR